MTGDVTYINPFRVADEAARQYSASSQQQTQRYEQ